MAFVYSLTLWNKRKFSGGETFLQRPRVQIPPRFNRLTLFNPACVHGVRPVKGTFDPRQGRLVIHGWFVNPRPFWTGPLTVNQIGEGLDDTLARLHFRKKTRLAGFASFRLKIEKSGKISKVQKLVQTLNHERVESEIAEQLRAMRFPAARSTSVLTLPLTFG